jgi:hypothetical protein
MLTCEPRRTVILDQEGIEELAQASMLGHQFVSMPTLIAKLDQPMSDLIVELGSGQSFVIDLKHSSAVPVILSSCHVAHELAHVSVGQLGQLQEYRQNLRANVWSIANDLRSLDVMERLSICNYISTTETSDRDYRLNVCAPSLHGPYGQTQYYQTVQDALSYHVVSIVLLARTFLQKALTTCREKLRLVNVAVGLLHAVAFFPFIFCSVRWERRRWFLFHGARPPTSTAQAMWACLPEACSRSLLAY